MMMSPNPSKSEIKGHTRKRSSFKLFDALQNHVSGDAIFNPSINVEVNRLTENISNKRHSRKGSSLDEVLEAIDTSQFKRGRAHSVKDILIDGSIDLDLRGGDVKETNVFGGREDVPTFWIDPTKSCSMARGLEKEEELAFSTPNQRQIHKKKVSETFENIFDCKGSSFVTPQNQVVGRLFSPPPLRPSYLETREPVDLDVPFVFPGASRVNSDKSVLFEDDRVGALEDLDFVDSKDHEPTHTKNDLKDESFLDYRRTNVAIKSIFAAAAIEMESPLKAGDVDSIFRTSSSEITTKYSESADGDSWRLRMRRSKDSRPLLPASNANYQSGFRPNLAIPNL